MVFNLSENADAMFYILTSRPLPELTQDIASKGLGIVYEICGGDQKKELVSMLVDTLVSGRRWVV